jgi:Ca-activated chloride channel family protein
MRSWKTLVLCAAAVIVVASLLTGQEQGPLKDPGGATVAKPRKPEEKKDGDGDLPKIPSQYKRNNVDIETQPAFKLDVDMVTLDVSVLDNKGHFIPGIPKGNFRILEDNVPQQVKAVNMGEAPLTISMVIEFSNKFQQYWGPVWYQTLQLAWGFASTLKPVDYVALVADEIKPEIH